MFCGVAWRGIVAPHGLIVATLFYSPVLIFIHNVQEEDGARWRGGRAESSGRPGDSDPFLFTFGIHLARASIVLFS